MRVLAMDIGGSSVKSGIASVEGGNVSFNGELSTSNLESREFTELQQVVADITAGVLGDARHIDAVGISTTGTVGEDGTVRSAGIFNGYKMVSWEEILLPVMGPDLPVSTLNDGRASAWAEYGRVRDTASIFAHFVVGTGVGGGIVISGKLLYGAQGAAAALGHIKISESSSVVCSCRKRGCVESLASAPAIARDWRESVGDPARNMEFSEIADAAVQGDELAISVIAAAGRHLGYGIANVMSIVNPQIITIGGGVVAATQQVPGYPAGGPYVSAAAETARELAFPRVAAETQILPAFYGNDGGLIGAALFAAMRQA